MIDRTQLRNIDWILVFLLLLNAAIGVIFIYSSSHYLPGNFALKQVFWILAGLAAFILLISIDYNLLISYSPFLYLLILAVLATLLIFGIVIAGTRSWVRLPFFQIQPSELMKIALVLVLARVFSEFKKSSMTWDRSIAAIGLTFFPVFLVSLQPDLGTALSYLPILVAGLILAGINKKLLVALLVLAVLLGAVGWNFLLKNYQKQRLNTLLFPEKDPLGSGYHALQSKIAIGSGGFLGKGFKKGTQSQLRFLPARHTDFIFSVIGEEFGFIGIVMALLFYFLFLARLFLSVSQARDRAGVYLIFLVAVLTASQFLINVLMTVGLFPIAGIPLPLLSYGGSSLLTNFMAVGLVVNVKMRRFAYL